MSYSHHQNVDDDDNDDDDDDDLVLNGQHQLPLQDQQLPPGEWSGLETEAMQEARCSLLLPTERAYKPKIKTLPPQRVYVYQDKAIQPKVGLTGGNSFYQNFAGATILQLEPSSKIQYKTMPITLVVAGRCKFSSRDYTEFAMMMRSRDQANAIQVPPNGTFDWPDVEAFMLCPVCGNFQDIPPSLSDGNIEQSYNLEQNNSPEKEDQTNSESDPTFWMLIHPIFQIQVGKANRILIATRTICRLVCLDCMEDLLDGLYITPSQKADKKLEPLTDEDGFPIENSVETKDQLSIKDIIEEVGSVTFLQDDPPRPEHVPNLDDELNAWTLFRLWEHSGTWEALLNDYKMSLSISMKSSQSKNGEANNLPVEDVSKKPDPPAATIMTSSANQLNKERYGRKCASPSCHRVHGKKDSKLHDIVRLSVVCEKCEAAYYCSKTCRKAAAEFHSITCMNNKGVGSGVNSQRMNEGNEKRLKKIPCDVCNKVLLSTHMKKCSKCLVANYCSVACQRQDWKTHKGICSGTT